MTGDCKASSAVRKSKRKKLARRELMDRLNERRKLQEQDEELGRPSPRIPDAGRKPPMPKTERKPPFDPLSSSIGRLDGSPLHGVNKETSLVISHAKKKKREKIW